MSLPSVSSLANGLGLGVFCCHLFRVQNGRKEFGLENLSYYEIAQAVYSIFDRGALVGRNREERIIFFKNLG